MKKIACARSGARFLSVAVITLTLGMAQQPSGRLRAWGFGASGQLGDGLFVDSAVPESVVNLSDVVAAAVGQNHSLGVKSDGSVWIWGNNSATPAAVSGLGSSSGVIAVAAGRLHSLALKSDGSVWAWGSNSSGQLGTGGGSTAVPTLVSGLGIGSGVVAIAAGFEHSMAVKADGSVLAWGINDFGELGDGTTTNRPVPVAVSGFASGSGVIAVSCGASHSLALKSDGSVTAWGLNLAGGVGDGTTVTRLRPVGVTGLGSGAGVVAISAGTAHSLALKSDGSILAWGFNAAGQLGDGTTVNRLTPVAVYPLGGYSGASPVNAFGAVAIGISAADSDSYALKSDGSVWAWGSNGNGELGSGDPTGQSAGKTTPVQVLALRGAIAIAQGPAAVHSVAIVQPVITLSTTSLNFGDQLVGSLSASQMITLQNDGQDALVINALSVAGAGAADFKLLAPPLPMTISPGASSALTVAFNPTAEFARLATLLFDDNGFQGPQFVALTGNGLVQADIALALGASPNPVRNGSNITYTISVKNGGPTLAPAVVMNDALPAGATFVSSKTSQGTCLTPAVGTTGMVTCNLGTLNSGAAVTVTVVLAVHISGGSTIVNTASAIAGAPDPNLSNNSVTVVTPVFGSRR